jgi:hypothetical protein
MEPNSYKKQKKSIIPHLKPFRVNSLDERFETLSVLFN